MFWIWFKELRVDKFRQNGKVKGKESGGGVCVSARRERRLCVCEPCVCVCLRVVSVKAKVIPGCLVGSGAIYWR